MNIPFSGMHPGQASPFGFAPAGQSFNPMFGQGFNPMFQQAMMAQMMAVMHMFFQLFAGGAAQGMAPAGANFGGGAAPAGGMGNFLGASPSGTGGGTSPANSSESSSSSSAAPVTDLSKVEGTEFGKRFAAAAEKSANRINTPGWCLKGVNDAMEASGLPVKREASAYMALDDFRANDRFREVKVPKDQLKSLPAGAVVIWEKGPKNPHGHISVALGDGREASSTVRKQLLLTTNFHVFLPK